MLNKKAGRVTSQNVGVCVRFRFRDLSHTWTYNSWSEALDRVDSLKERFLKETQSCDKVCIVIAPSYSPLVLPF